MYHINDDISSPNYSQIQITNDSHEYGFFCNKLVLATIFPLWYHITYENSIDITKSTMIFGSTFYRERNEYAERNSYIWWHPFKR